MHVTSIMFVAFVVILTYVVLHKVNSPHPPQDLINTTTSNTQSTNPKPSPHHLTTTPPQTSLILPRHLINQRRPIKRHSLHIRLRRHRLPLIPHLTQQLEIINIKCRRAREKQRGLLVCRITESVWRADRDGHVIAGLGVDGFEVAAGVGRVRDVERDCAGGDVEGLVVHFVPVGRGAGGFGGEG
jgi:hypothetical protein